MGVIAWWIIKQSVNTRPWEASAPYTSSEDFSGRSLPQPDAKLGLFIFLVVVTSLFALFISAYTMRMKLGDWRPLPDPDLLWLNTGALILSSIALQWAHVAAKREQVDHVRNGLLAGGFFAFAFIGGAAASVATTGRCRLLCAIQPGQCLLLPDHGVARPTLVGWRGGLGDDDDKTIGRY